MLRASDSASEDLGVALHARPADEVLVAGHSARGRRTWRRASISASTRSSSRGFLKGGRVDVRVEEPLDLASGRLRVLRQKVEAWAVPRFLPVDERLAKCPAHPLSDDVVREFRCAASSAYSSGDQVEIGTTKAAAKFVLSGLCDTQGSGVVPRSRLRCQVSLLADATFTRHAT